MAFLTRPAHLPKGNKQLFTLNPEELAAFPVITDDYYKNISNWKEVLIHYKSMENGQEGVLHFDKDIWTCLYAPTLRARAGIWRIERIVIKDYDHGLFLIEKNNIPNLSSFDTSVTSNATNGFLHVTNGQIVEIPAGSSLQYSSLIVDSGATLKVLPGGAITTIECVDKFVLNGQIEAKSGFHTGGFWNKTSPLGENLSYSITQSAGGNGGSVSGTGGSGATNLPNFQISGPSFPDVLSYAQPLTYAGYMPMNGTLRSRYIGGKVVYASGPFQYLVVEDISTHVAHDVWVAKDTMYVLKPTKTLDSYRWASNFTEADFVNVDPSSYTNQLLAYLDPAFVNGYLAIPIFAVGGSDTCLQLGMARILATTNYQTVTQALSRLSGTVNATETLAENAPLTDEHAATQTWVGSLYVDGNGNAIPNGSGTYLLVCGSVLNTQLIKNTGLVPITRDSFSVYNSDFGNSPETELQAHVNALDGTKSIPPMILNKTELEAMMGGGGGSTIPGGLNASGNGGGGSFGASGLGSSATEDRGGNSGARLGGLIYGNDGEDSVNVSGGGAGGARGAHGQGLYIKAPKIEGGGTILASGQKGGNGGDGGAFSTEREAAGGGGAGGSGGKVWLRHQAGTPNLIIDIGAGERGVRGENLGTTGEAEHGQAGTIGSVDIQTF